jgi:hypothetical protein
MRACRGVGGSLREKAPAPELLDVNLISGVTTGRGKRDRVVSRHEALGEQPDTGVGKR